MVKLTGDESLALGAVLAGVSHVSSYPGSPATEIVDLLIQQSNEHGLYVEWSTNEETAFEETMGASLAGLRALTCMKQVGISHIIDPLMGINLTGCPGGLVILAGDDPGATVSPNEQDSRVLAYFAEIPVLEPRSCQGALDIMIDAFELSERYQLPVMVRIVPEIKTLTEEVVLREKRPQNRPGFRRENPWEWRLLPSQIKMTHGGLHEKNREIGEEYDREMSMHNEVSVNGEKGVLAFGYPERVVRDLLGSRKVSVLGLSTILPLPAGTVAEFLEPLTEVLILEDIEPLGETLVRSMIEQLRLDAKIKGKMTGHAGWEGGLDETEIARALENGLGIKLDYEEKPKPESLSSILPEGFCPNCPYDMFFSVLKEVVDGFDIQPVIVGDQGCFELLEDPPYEMRDVKYSLGSSIAVAHGIAQAEPERTVIALIGDSSFFHTGINGLLNASYNRSNLFVAVMDNYSAALTGFQPHPGSGVTALGERQESILIENVARSFNIGYVKVLDPKDRTLTEKVIREGIDYPGVSVVVARRGCPDDAFRHRSMEKPGWMR